MKSFSAAFAFAIERSVLQILLLACLCVGSGVTNSIVSPDHRESLQIVVEREILVDTARMVVEPRSTPFQSAIHIRTRAPAKERSAVAVTQPHIIDSCHSTGDKLGIEYWLKGRGMACAQMRTADSLLWSSRVDTFNCDQWTRFTHVMQHTADRRAGLKMTVCLGDDSVDVSIGGIDVYLVRKQIRIPAVPWAIQAMDIDSDGITEVLAGGMGVDSLFCYATTGQRRWACPTGGMVASIALGDIRPDVAGVEIAAVSLDTNHSLRVFTSQGSELWSVPFPLYTKTGVAVGDVDGDGELEVACTGRDSATWVFTRDGRPDSACLKGCWNAGNSHGGLTAADIDNDGTDELLIPMRAKIRICDWNGKAWQYRDCRPPSGAMYAATIATGNLDSDSGLEIVAGTNWKSRIDVFEHDGAYRWVNSNEGKLSWHYWRGLCATGNLDADTAGRDDVVVLTWNDPSASFCPRTSLCPTLRVLDGEGRMLKGIHAPQAFSTLTIQRGGTHDFLLLGSDFDDPDHRIYLFGETNYDSLERGILSLQRNAAPVSSDLHAMRTAVDALPPLPAPETGDRIHLLVHLFMLGKGSVGGARANDTARPVFSYPGKRLLRDLSNENVVAEMEWCTIHEDHPSLPRVTNVPSNRLRRSTILYWARYFERDSIPFYIEYSHGDDRFYTLECCSLLAVAAPTMLRGFVSTEFFHSISYTDFDCKDLACWPLIADSLCALSELCRRHELKLILCPNGGLRQSLSDTGAHSLRRLLTPENKHVIVPMVKTNSAGGIDGEIATALGLWKSGYVADIGYSTQQDLWEWRSAQPIGAMPADILLRMELSALACGATYLRVEGAQPYATNMARLKSDARIAGRLVQWEGNTRHHRGLVYDLMNKGYIRPISPAQLLNTSSVGFLHTGEQFRLLTQNGRHEWRESRRWLFGTLHALEAVPKFMAASFLSGARFFQETVFPVTKYGLWTIVPRTDEQQTCTAKAFTTDGRRIHNPQSGKWDSATVAMDYVRKAFADASTQLPFTCDSCFMAVHMMEDAYRLYLMDTEMFSPKDGICEVKVRTAQLAPDAKAGVDVITGDSLAVSKGRIRVPVSAGLFRIVDIRRRVHGYE